MEVALDMPKGPLRFLSAQVGVGLPRRRWSRHSTPSVFSRAHWVFVLRESNLKRVGTRSAHRILLRQSHSVQTTQCGIFYDDTANLHTLAFVPVVDVFQRPLHFDLHDGMCIDVDALSRELRVPRASTQGIVPILTGALREIPGVFLIVGKTGPDFDRSVHGGHHVAGNRAF